VCFIGEAAAAVMSKTTAFRATFFDAWGWGGGEGTCCYSLRDLRQKLVDFSGVALKRLQLGLQQGYLLVGLGCSVAGSSLKRAFKWGTTELKSGCEVTCACFAMTESARDLRDAV
jgi:hypothetical protein